MKIAELAKRVAQEEQMRKKKETLIAMVERILSEAGLQMAQLKEQEQKEADNALKNIKTIDDLRLRVASLEKELFDQTSKARRLEEELREQVAKNQQMMLVARGTQNTVRYDMAAEDDYDEGEVSRRINEEKEERMIPMSTVISFSTTRSTQESVQTLVDLLFFALNDRTSDEEKAIKKMISDFKSSMRPQMDVKDSTQNFYL